MLELDWDWLLPMGLSVTERIDRLKIICSKHLLVNFIDAIVGVIKKVRFVIFVNLIVVLKEEWKRDIYGSIYTDRHNYMLNQDIIISC